MSVVAKIGESRRLCGRNGCSAGSTREQDPRPRLGGPVREPLWSAGRRSGHLTRRLLGSESRSPVDVFTTVTVRAVRGARRVTATTTLSRPGLTTLTDRIRIPRPLTVTRAGLLKPLPRTASVVTRPRGTAVRLSDVIVGAVATGGGGAVGSCGRGTVTPLSIPVTVAVEMPPCLPA